MNLPFITTLTEEHIGGDWKNYLVDVILDRYSGNRGGIVEVISDPNAGPVVSFELQPDKAGPGWGDEKGYILSKFPKGGLDDPQGNPVRKLHWYYNFKYAEDSIFGWGGKSGIGIQFGDYSVGTRVEKNGYSVSHMWHYIKKTGFDWGSTFPIEDKAYFDVYEYSPKQLPGLEESSYGLHQLSHIINRGQWLRFDGWIQLNSWEVLEDGSRRILKDGETIICINGNPVFKDIGWGYFDRDVDCYASLGFFHGGNLDWMSSPKMKILFQPGGFDQERPEFCDLPEVGIETMFFDIYNSCEAPILTDSQVIEGLIQEIKDRQLTADQIAQVVSSSLEISNEVLYLKIKSELEKVGPQAFFQAMNDREFKLKVQS